MMTYLLPMAVLGLAAAAYRWFARGLVPIEPSESLVVELCRHHGLPASVRKLMLRIGRAADLTQPAAMFLSQDEFESAIEAARRRLRFSDTDQQHLGLIRRRLFGQLAN